MAYQAPGVYAQFVNSAGTAANPGASRILAIIGTGVQTYTVYNEPIVRNPNTSADVLSNSDTYQIIAVTSKPYYPNKTIANNIFFTQTGTTGTGNVPEFNLEQGEFISWTPQNSGTISSPNPGHTSGASAWIKAQSTININGIATPVSMITATVDSSDPNVEANTGVNESFLLENNTYQIEITYVDPKAGTYRIVDMNSGEIIGEYTAGQNPNYEAIPGVKLLITSTFVEDTNDPTGQTSLTQVGDYVTITTTAPETYGLPSGTITSVNSNGSVVINGTNGNGTTYTGPKSPNNGQVYYVSYKYRKPDTAYEPKMFFNYHDVTSTYGNYQITTSGKVLNSLALGAQIAMLNGVSQLVCVQAKSENDGDINNAIDSLMRSYPGIDTVNAIVPLTGFWNTYNVAAHLSAHVTEMSTPEFSKERMGYVGAINPADDVSTLVSDVSAYEDERLVFVVPASATMNYQDPTTGAWSVNKVPSSFLAAAVASVALSQDVATPLTNKVINGFVNLGDLYMDSEMNMLAGAGALVLKQNGPIITIRHGITTNTASVDLSEITVIQIRDYVIQAVRQSLGQLYIGQKLMPTLVANVKSTLQNILNQFVSQQIILSFNISSVSRSQLNPTEIDVSFTIEAVYPLNYIDISFGLSSTYTG